MIDSFSSSSSSDEESSDFGILKYPSPTGPNIGRSVANFRNRRFLELPDT